MSYVFVSYEEKDCDFAEALMLRLKNVGIPVWEQANITHSPAERYAQTDQGLRNASALIVVMTPEAKASEAVTYEWIFALGAGVPVIPLLLQETSLHSRLVMLSRFDFTNSAMLPWDGFIETLQMTLKETEPHRVFTPHGTPFYIREAIKALDSANSDDREGAIDNLAQSDHPIAVQALIGALSHPLQDVRIFAALERGDVGDNRAISGLLDALQSEENAICRRAIYALGNIGDPIVAPRLIELLHHRPEGIRYAITEALEKMGDVVVPILQNVLNEENVEMKVWAIQTLKSFGEAASSSLIQALDDKERAVKVYTISALGDIGGPAAVTRLIKVLESEREEWSIRGNAAETLGKIGDASAVPSLIVALSYNDENTRREAAKALRQIGSSAVPQLIEALGSAEGELRRRVIAQLRHIGTPEALSALNTKSRR